METPQVREAMKDTCAGTCPSGCCHKRDVISWEVKRLRGELAEQVKRNGELVAQLYGYESVEEMEADMAGITRAIPPQPGPEIEERKP